ncbi:MAG: hypothetical protein ABI459_12290 [Deltaproteobacteria bacterium]
MTDMDENAYRLFAEQNFGLDFDQMVRDATASQDIVVRGGLSEVFAVWTNPDARRIFACERDNGERLVRCEFVAGGREISESRWKNQWVSRKETDVRVIRPDKLIVLQSVTEVRHTEQLFFTNERIEFKAAPEDSTVIFWSVQVATTLPAKLDNYDRLMKSQLDRFANYLKGCDPKSAP